MSLFVLAVIGFVIFNVVGLVLAKRWLRFVVFYVVDVAIWVGFSRLDAEPLVAPKDDPDEGLDAARPPLVLSAALLALAGLFLSRGEWLFGAAFLVVGLWLARAARIRAAER